MESLQIKEIDMISLSTVSMIMAWNIDQALVFKFIVLESLQKILTITSNSAVSVVANS